MKVIQHECVTGLFTHMMCYQVINDIYLPTEKGTTQVDHIIVSQFGVFVIETKNYSGWIFGDEKSSKWTQVLYKNKSQFQNPLRQNYKHTKTISELLDLPMSYIKPVVVFVGDATFKTDMPDNVVQSRNLIGYIQDHTKPIIQDNQVPEILSVIQEWSSTLSDQQKTDHVKNLKGNFRQD